MSKQSVEADLDFRLRLLQIGGVTNEYAPLSKCCGAQVTEYPRVISPDGLCRQDDQHRGRRLMQEAFCGLDVVDDHLVLRRFQVRCVTAHRFSRRVGRRPGTRRLFYDG